MVLLSREEKFVWISVSPERMLALVLGAEAGAQKKRAEGVEGPEVNPAQNLEVESQEAGPGREKVGIIRTKKRIVQ
jgi:hypothetical protein